LPFMRLLPRFAASLLPCGPAAMRCKCGRWTPPPPPRCGRCSPLLRSVSAVAVARLAERCSTVPSGVAGGGRRKKTADAEPVLLAGGAAPAGSGRTSRRTAQRRRQRQRRSAAAAATPPQAAPVLTGVMRAAATWLPHAEDAPLMWAALTTAAPPFTPRTAAPGRPLPHFGVDIDAKCALQCWRS
jgi:hypothetical protein